MEKNSGGTVLHTTVYYPAGGAVRVDNTLSYVLGDQLGSASLTMSSAGSYMAARRSGLSFSRLLIADCLFKFPLVK